MAASDLLVNFEKWFTRTVIDEINDNETWHTHIPTTITPKMYPMITATSAIVKFPCTMVVILNLW